MASGTGLRLVIKVKAVQSRKVIISMVVTLAGMVTESRAVHPRKACLPMVVTLLGMVSEVRAVQV
jgi:hypothetical protein